MRIVGLPRSWSGRYLDAARVYCQVPLCPSSCRRGCLHPLLWSLVLGFCFLFMESFSFLLTRDVCPSSCQFKTQMPVCLRKRFDCLFYSTWLRMKWVLGTSILSTWAPQSLISKPYILLYGSQVTKKITWCFRISGDLKGQRGRNCRITMFLL